MSRAAGEREISVRGKLETRYLVSYKDALALNPARGGRRMRPGNGCRAR